MSEALLEYGCFLFISLPTFPHTPRLPPSLISLYPYLVFRDKVLLCSSVWSQAFNAVP